MASKQRTALKQKPSPSRQNASVGREITTKTEQHYSGPIPPPGFLRDYEAIVPGSAERLIKMAESDQSFQQKITSDALIATKELHRRGQWMAFALGVTALIVSLITLYWGHPAVAGIIGGTTAVGFVSAFIVDRVKKSDEETYRK